MVFVFFPQIYLLPNLETLSDSGAMLPPSDRIPTMRRIHHERWHTCRWLPTEPSPVLSADLRQVFSLTPKLHSYNAWPRGSWNTPIAPVAVNRWILNSISSVYITHKLVHNFKIHHMTPPPKIFYKIISHGHKTDQSQWNSQTQIWIHLTIRLISLLFQPNGLKNHGWWALVASAI